MLFTLFMCPWEVGMACKVRIIWGPPDKKFNTVSVCERINAILQVNGHFDKPNDSWTANSPSI